MTAGDLADLARGIERVLSKRVGQPGSTIGPREVKLVQRISESVEFCAPEAMMMWRRELITALCAGIANGAIPRSWKGTWAEELFRLIAGDESIAREIQRARDPQPPIWPAPSSAAADPPAPAPKRGELTDAELMARSALLFAEAVGCLAENQARDRAGMSPAYTVGMLGADHARAIERELELRSGRRCDGDHAAPACLDPECWQGPGR